MNLKTYAVILAGGKSERFGKEKPKQFTMLAGKMVIEHTIEVFENHKDIDHIIIVTLEDYIDVLETLSIKNEWKKVSKILAGGATRQESSYIAISSIEDMEAKVLFHDGARPFVRPKIIDDTIKALDTSKAVDVAINSADTIIKIDDKNYIQEIPKRKYYLRGQTPQGFHLSVIKQAHNNAIRDDFYEVTDDCGLVHHYNLSDIYVVNGDESNIKITYPIDLYIADKLFQLKTYQNLKNIEDNKLKDKVGVVFGASEGIGESICQIAKEYNVKIYGFSRKDGVDISKRSDIKQALQRVYEENQKIDFVIVTAGVLVKKPLMHCSDDEILEQVHTNYLGSLYVAQESFDYLKESHGHLLLFSSSSYTRGRANYVVYSSLKSAVVNLTQALSDEWSSFDIKVNCIVPARTATNMRVKNFGKEAPEKLLQPSQVAQEALKVVSSCITGEVIEVKKL